MNDSENGSWIEMFCNLIYEKQIKPLEERIKKLEENNNINDLVKSIKKFSK